MEMPKKVDITRTAQEWMQKYKTEGAILWESSALIQEYGREQYNQIFMKIRELKKKAAAERRNAPNSPARQYLREKLGVLKSRFKENTRYAFVVTEQQKGIVWGRVKDEYGWEHPISLPKRFIVGDCITCNVYGFYTKITEDGDVIVNLRLEDPKKLPANISPEEYEPEEGPQYIKSPDKWFGEVAGLGKHICGKPFTCSCCGRDFPARKGYRIELKEIYFCMDCKRKVFTPEGKGWRGRIISTPMGNKR